jgi:nicotinate-nucleotide adenylyltransferase
MRLGIFGGTFDPVHYGHLLLAEQCREQCRLDEVWFLPAGIPPHKQSRAIAPGNARVEMLEFAVAGHPSFRIDRRELVRNGPSYTVETLGELQAEDPSRELYFLVGADSLSDFPTWREPSRILELAMLAVVNRVDAPPCPLDGIRQALGAGAEQRIQFVTIPGIGLSSSDIRRRIRSGNSIRFMTPRAVECYIQAQGLYRE